MLADGLKYLYYPYEPSSLHFINAVYLLIYML
jgi:hypothetical protein